MERNASVIFIGLVVVSMFAVGLEFQVCKLQFVMQKQQQTVVRLTRQSQDVREQLNRQSTAIEELRTAENGSGAVVDELRSTVNHNAEIQNYNNSLR